MKKIVSVLLCLVMAMSLCTVAFAAGTEKEYCTCGGPQLQYDNGDGTHSAMCATCGKDVENSTQPHIYQYDNPKHEGNINPNGKYCICGAEKPAECDHMGNNWRYESNGDGTHDVICNDCDKHVSPNMPCEYVDGKCITCGFVCKHGDTDMWSYIRVDETYHKTVCKVCDTVVNANVKHKFVNGKCVCGAVECKHEGAQKLVANKDGKTHNAYCPTCDKLMSENIPHTYQYADANAKNLVGEETGKYCLCGAEKPTTPACKHEGAQKLVPNKDKKTHNAYCPVCNELMAEKIPHTYQYDKNGEFVGRGGKYCLCGAKKSTSSAGGSTTTTTTNTTKSPKTGDMGVVLYAATALLSLSGTAVVIKKRKNDK